jgi:hypothetical protein
MQESIWILVSHVSGKWMKAEGTDGGTSRGQEEGVTEEEDMLDFIPWNVVARDWIKLLEPWLRS